MEQVLKKEIKARFGIIALVASACIALLMMGDVKVLNNDSVIRSLPDNVGEYQGEEIRFCQDSQCLRVFPITALDGKMCPSCGGELDPLFPGEKRLLPGDTILIRKEYSNSRGRRILVSIVLSGKERTSIHRPQMCLTGSGRTIESQEIIKAPVKGREDLELMMLNLQRESGGRNSSKSRKYSAFAYWFTAKNHETPYHLSRTWWMAVDSIFKGVSYRWAYISIMTDRSPDSNNHRRAITAFVSELYPLITSDQ